MDENFYPENLLGGSVRSRFEQFRAVLGGEFLGFLLGCGLRLFVRFRWRGGAGGHGNPDLREELLLSGRRTDAEQSRRGPGGVGEGMRRVSRDAHGLSCVHGRLLYPKSGFDLAF